MTRQLSNKFLFIFLFTLMAIGASAQAQERDSNNEESESSPSANIIELEFEPFESDALKNFLKEYRTILQQSKLDASDALKKQRKDSTGIKKENFQALKITRQKIPKVVLKRKGLRKNQFPLEVPETVKIIDPDLPQTPEEFIFKTKFDEPRAPKQREKLLSLEERQRLAKIKNERRNKFFDFQTSEMGRLKNEIEQDPLREHQEKLSQLSGKIKKLLEKIKRKQGKEPAAFLDLGNAYLESQRYLDSLDAEDRYKLTSYAPLSGTTLGSYELALWTFKMALTQDPNNGDTNFLLGKVFSEKGDMDRALERVRNAEKLFIKNHQPEKAIQTRTFIESLRNTSAKKPKTEF